MNERGGISEKKQLRMALAGNPNTGKSTLFNTLTGLKQHTGNWSGKTVGNAVGTFSLADREVSLYDLPGVYSLFSDSAEESEAKNFLCRESCDAVLVILDATALERNLPLALQVMELQDTVVFCLNLIDEAEKKGISVEIEKLEEMTGVPVVKMAARQGIGIAQLKELLLAIVKKEVTIRPKRMDWDSITPETEAGYETEAFREKRSLLFLQRAEEICRETVLKQEERDSRTERIDRWVLSTKWGLLLMLLLLGGVFWITVAGANLPSAFLMQRFELCGEMLREGMQMVGSPPWLESLLLDGIWLTVTWVVAVMLPPMAIFFPLFTLLEDFGLLPRIAFLLDGIFQKAGCHGKQVLTMWVRKSGLEKEIGMRGKSGEKQKNCGGTQREIRYKRYRRRGAFYCAAAWRSSFRLRKYSTISAVTIARLRK